jgi:hypothetical protein
LNWCLKTVNETTRKEQIVYECENCGFGYDELDEAERCEEYCNTQGHWSPEIVKNAVYKPATRLLPVTA